MAFSFTIGQAEIDWPMTNEHGDPRDVGLYVPTIEDPRELRYTKNTRDISYSAFALFASVMGPKVERLFYGRNGVNGRREDRDEECLLYTHPGVARITHADLATMIEGRLAYERRWAESLGKRFLLAREQDEHVMLLAHAAWFEHWMNYALVNCARASLRNA
jgi:hypothetical protein